MHRLFLKLICVVHEASLLYPSQAVLDVISLSPEDKTLFLSRLDSKDLSATVDQRTLVHLLLRAEGGGHSEQLRRPPASSGLHVERVMPQHAPEGSRWRRTKVRYLPSLNGTTLCVPDGVLGLPYCNSANDATDSSTSLAFYRFWMKPMVQSTR